MNIQTKNPKQIIGNIEFPENTFFGSDHHTGHGNIVRFCGRPFRDDSISEIARLIVSISGGNFDAVFADIRSKSDTEIVAAYPIIVDIFDKDIQNEMHHNNLPDIDAMNADILAKHNAIVGPNDFFVLVGDACMGKTGNANDPNDPKPGTLDLISQMNGKKILVAGNHDKASFLVNKSVEKRDRMVAMFLRAGFEAVYDHVEATYKGRRFAINHFPYAGDHMEEDRYSFARPEFNGLPICHGHIHDENKQTVYRGVTQYNVGIDAHGGKPTHIEKLMEAFDNPVDDYTKDIWVTS